MLKLMGWLLLCWFLCLLWLFSATLLDRDPVVVVFSERIPLKFFN